MSVGTQGLASREAHIAEGKRQALKLLDAGEVSGAMTFMIHCLDELGSDDDEPGMIVGMVMMIRCEFVAPKAARLWIEGLK